MKRKQTRKRRQGNLVSSCSRCFGRVEFTGWMKLTAFLNDGRVCDVCKATLALAGFTALLATQKERRNDA